MQHFRKSATQPMEPWVPGYDMDGVSVADPDRMNGSPKEGDMIAVNPADPTDRWLVAAAYFAANYEEVV